MYYITKQRVMKKILTVLFFFTYSLSNGQEKQISKISHCNSKMSVQHPTPKHGILIHVRCGCFLCSKENFFYLTRSDSIFWINQSNEILGNIRVRSIGPRFFIATTSRGSAYKYTFNTGKWTELTVSDPGWSTGERE